jgi:mercuric ion binding protein
MHKQLMLFCCCMLLLAGRSVAQQPKSQWVTIKSANLRCWECKERLERQLVIVNKAEMESGIIQWKIQLLQGEIKLQYWPDRTSPDAIRVAMNNAGFDADSSLAVQDAYLALPLICKRPADGGGQKKGAPPCHVQPYY